jgi:tetrapyrrole methylase family protein/MazG family protein
VTAPAPAAGSGVIAVVGLGPAGADLTTAGALAALSEAAAGGMPVFFRTARHPAAAELLEGRAAGANTASFDDRYGAEATFEAVYESITTALLTAAEEAPRIVYAVPGSPFVAERTVELLRTRAPGAGVSVEILPGLSFCDLAWGRLAVDPLAAGVRLVDGLSFGPAAAGDHGPLLVAQCWSNAVLSDVKLAIEEPAAGQRAIVLHHLGLADEQVIDVAWEDLDRVVEADHLTSVFVEHMSAPVAGELVRLSETVARLRHECPWDREQSHASLVRHLLEETYEAIDAIEGLGAEPAGASPEQVAHLEEELGDVLCQVVFHATLAREEGLFDLADVARTITDKLVRRHPHVFGDVVADTAEDVLVNWERSKQLEKGRANLLDGIPPTMPSLARAATIERKLASAGLGWRPDPLVVGRASPAAGGATAIVALARAMAAAGEDPEGAVRRALDDLVVRAAELEGSAAARGLALADVPATEIEAWREGGRPPAG